MAEKFRESLSGVLNTYDVETWNGQHGHSEYVTIVRSTEKVDAVFHRPRPIPLGVTPMVVTKTWRDPGVYSKSIDVPTPVRNWEKASGTVLWMNATRPPPMGFPQATRTVTAQAAAAAANIALIKARAKFTGDKASFGESLGEFRESASMIASRLRDIAAIANMVRRKDLSGLARKLKRDVTGLATNSKSAANFFLELEFGWRPLMSDIYSGLHYRSQKLRKGDTRKKNSGYMKKKDDTSVGSSEQLGGRAGARGTVSNPRAANLNAYGLANPAETAWNLVKWSFLVDWFLPIGSIFSSLTAFIGLNDVVEWTIAVSGTEYYYRGAPWGGCFQRNKGINRAAGLIWGGLLPGPKYLIAVRGSVEKVALEAALLRQQLGDVKRVKRWRSLKPK